MDENTARKLWMGLLARAPQGRIVTLLVGSGLSFEFDHLRAPETGGVMVQGRAGGTGTRFNLGEMTVTRAAVRLSSGVVGHGYVQGRSGEDAEAAALIDALMQTNRAAEIEAKVLEPLQTEEQARRNKRARKAAATKVEFFTMAREAT